MKNIKNIFLILLSVALFNSCEEDQFESSLDYASFANSTYSTGVTPDGSSTIDINVYATKTATSDRTFNITVDGSSAPTGSYSVPSSVTIPSGTNKGTFTVELSDTNLDCFNDVVMSLDPPEGITANSETTLTYFQTPSGACSTEVSGTLDFDFDDWASEVSYEIRDVLGGVVVSGPSSPWIDGEPSASIPVTLCAGRCYTLIVNDAFGDGLSSPGGSFTLTVGGNVYASAQGNYGASSSTGFQIN
ncbi:hypothetical protein UMM65_04090 [Aureibaculum sp. 2210JD6-5]|uniref:hypothetical protein n=1 Tax=Aureibaculum sp. 2210JD6-5 TaxID=3103957 RepID=UPI002AACCA8D|nr:hypothetical protein [Aureibaculum sp. 2210JD6-5]MDY7394409.1 hypothetical protein [Aureibaculum sp. 2210JD6-5]